MSPGFQICFKNNMVSIVYAQPAIKKVAPEKKNDGLTFVSPPGSDSFAKRYVKRFGPSFKK